MTAPLEDLLTPADVRRVLGVSRSQAYALMKQMDHITVGERGIRVTAGALQDYLKRNTTRVKRGA